MCPKDTKISLSDAEIDLIQETTFFDMKRGIFNKITGKLHSLEHSYAEELLRFQSLLPTEAITTRGKVSRGENYRGLPYLILDYPRLFSNEGVFAYRTLFWWGMPLSFTFHISGYYLDKVRTELDFQNLLQMVPDILICVNTNQWEHHFDADNYISLKSMEMDHQSLNEMIRTKKFLKLTVKLPLSSFPEIERTGINQLNAVMQFLYE